MKPLALFPGLGFLLFLFLPVTDHAAQQLMDAFDNLTMKRVSATAAAENGYFKDALERERIALQAAEDRFGPYHPQTMQVLNDLAAIQRVMGHYAEAEKNYKWSLAVREKTLDSNDPLLAESLDNLASLYEDLGRDQEAEALVERAFQIQKKASNGRGSASRLELLLLGKIRINLGKYEEAEKALEENISPLEIADHQDPRLFLESLTTLAQVHQAAGHFPQAEARLRQDLDYCRKHYKADGVEIADALEKLGDFYHSRGQKEKASENYELALKIFKPITPLTCTYPAIPYLLRTASALQATGDETPAKKLREEVLKTLQDSLGPDHPRVALCLAELAEDDWALGDKPGALKKMEAAHAILKTSLGENHPLALSVQERLQQLENGH